MNTRRRFWSLDYSELLHRELKAWMRDFTPAGRPPYMVILGGTSKSGITVETFNVHDELAFKLTFGEHIKGGPFA